MIFPIYFPDSVVRSKEANLVFKKFFQAMANRIAVGSCRYGKATGNKDPDRGAQYCSRMTVELAAYKRTGNVEHLYNIANYAYLEFAKPENPKSHHDPLVDSVTRRKFKLE